MYSKKHPQIRTLLFMIIFALFSSLGYSQSVEVNSDQQLVHEAIEDYVLALYEVQPERIVRSVDTTLHKIGYYEYEGASYNHVPMTYKQLYNLSCRYRKRK
jgi:hypothetical protein